MIAHVAIADAICYVFGAIGMIWFCSDLAPRLLGIDLKAESLALEKSLGMSRTTPGVQSGYRLFELRAYEVPADARIVGLSLAEAESRFPEARMFVLRLRRGGEIKEVAPDLLIEAGDTLAVGGHRAPLTYDPWSPCGGGGGPGAPRQPLPNRRVPHYQRCAYRREPAVRGRHALGEGHLPAFPPAGSARPPTGAGPGRPARRRPEAHRAAGNGRTRRDAHRPTDRADYRDRFYRARVRHLSRRAGGHPSALQHCRDRGRDRHQHRCARRRASGRPSAYPTPALRPNPGWRSRADDLARPCRLRGDDRASTPARSSSRRSRTPASASSSAASS